MLLMKAQFGYKRACSVKGSCARSQLHKLPSQWKHRTASFSPVEKSMESIHYTNHFQQVCIPVGCVPAAHWRYPGRGVCYRGMSATGGVCYGGCLLPRGCLPLGGVCHWGEGLLPGGACLQGLSATDGGDYYQGVSATRGVSATGECLLLGGCLPLGGVCYWGCLLPGGVCYWGGGVCYQEGVYYQGFVSASGGCLLLGGCLLPREKPPVYRILDTHYRKHYLGHNFVEVGKNIATRLNSLLWSPV